MRISTLALVLATVSSAAMAQASDPAASHIRQVRYSATQRIDVVGVVGQPVTFTLPKGEEVYRVVQSARPSLDGKLSEAGWQGPGGDDIKDTPLGNVLPLWPVEVGQSTLTLLTKTGDGTQKVYVFRLIARAASPGAEDAPDVVQNLVFTDAPPPSPQAVAAWVAKKHADDTAKAIQKIKVDALIASQDTCHYYAKGKKINAITPRCPLDNGEWTYLRFPGLERKPAVYVVGEGDDPNHERLARQHAEGDRIVVEEIAQRFRLRLGDEVLDIINSAYNPEGSDPNTGTLAHGVTRQILSAKP